MHSSNERLDLPNPSSVEECFIAGDTIEVKNYYHINIYKYDQDLDSYQCIQDPLMTVGISSISLSQDHLVYSIKDYQYDSFKATGGSLYITAKMLTTHILFTNRLSIQTSVELFPTTGTCWLVGG